MKKLLSKILKKSLSVMLSIVMAVSLINVKASFQGYQIQSVGSTLQGYTPYGYTQIVNQTLNPNYGVYLQISYKTEMVNSTTAKVYLYTHGWISTDAVLGYGLALGVSLNGTDMTPNACAGLWNGASQYGVIVHSNSDNSTPTDKRLGSFDAGEGKGNPHSWDVLYTFTVSVGEKDQTVSLNFSKHGSGFFNLGSICSNTYNLSLNRPVQEVPKHNLTVSVSANEGSPSNNVTIKVDNKQVFSGAIQSGSSKTVQVEEEATYEITTTTPDGYSTSISATKGQVGKSDVNIVIVNTKLHTHSWSSWTTTKEATCTTSGSRERKCSGCGEVQREEIAAKGHSYSYTTTKEPTCTATGTKVGKCSNCGNEVSESIPALGHNFGAMEKVKDPTCTQEGLKQAKCSRCSEKKNESIPALGHSFGSMSVIKEPTCTTEGQKQATCTRCSEKKTEAIKALGHNYGNWTTTKQPTCTTAGERQTTCSRCNKNITEAVSPLGHNYKWVITKAATETAEGSKDYKCDRCGKVAKTEVIPKISSNPTPTEPNPSTEPEPGEQGNEITNPDEGNPGEENPSGNDEPVMPTAEEIAAMIKKNVDEYLAKIENEYAKLNEAEYTKKNWKLINGYRDEAINEVTYTNSVDPILYDCVVDKFIEDINSVEKKVPREAREFGTKDYIELGVMGISLITIIAVAVVLRKQDKKVG